jgi:hypothetical protein
MDMIDQRSARLRTHRNNIGRCRQLLKTELSELERRFIERRLNEEISQMESLAASAVPLNSEIPEPPRDFPPAA